MGWIRKAAGRCVRFIAREFADEKSTRSVAAPIVRAPITPVRDRAIKVVFVMEFAESWASFDSVWQAFRADPACEATVVAVAQSSYHDQVKTTPGQFLAASDIPFTTSEFYDVALAKPDIVFFHSPYDEMRPASLRLARVQSHVGRIVYIPYGFEIGGGDTRVINQFNHELQQQAWKVFVRSQRFKRLYRKMCRAGDAHVVVTGHPMVDAVHGRTRETADAALRAQIGGRKTVLWNPHYGEYRDQHDFSTFLRWRDVLLDIYDKRQDQMLVLRPHPMLFTHLVKEGIMSATEIEQFVRTFSTTANLAIDERPDFTHAFALSDALMSDTSSFLTLYGATGKPIQYLPNPSGPGLNSEGELVSLYYTGDSAESLRDFVDMVGRGEDPMKEKRLNGFREFVHQPPEGAGLCIKNYVVDAVRLGL